MPGQWEFLVPDPGYASSLARFDLQNFGRAAWPQAVWEEALRRKEDHYLIAVACGRTLRSLPRIIAAGGISAGPQSEVLTVAVAQSFRRRGIARMLLGSLLRWAYSAGGAHEVFLEVRRADAGAQALYREFGFRPVGLRKRYYPDDDALIMKLDLSALRKAVDVPQGSAFAAQKKRNTQINSHTNS